MFLYFATFRYYKNIFRQCKRNITAALSCHIRKHQVETKHIRIQTMDNEPPRLRLPDLLLSIHGQPLRSTFQTPASRHLFDNRPLKKQRITQAKRHPLQIKRNQSIVRTPFEKNGTAK